MDSGLIFIAQKKIESYNAELIHLRDNQDKITAEALQVNFLDRLNAMFYKKLKYD